MPLQEKYIFILEDIEASVIKYYRKYPELTDHGVARIYEALGDHFSAISLNRPPKNFDLADLEKRILKSIVRICSALIEETPPDGMEPITPEIILLCLKTMKKSLQKWTKRYGRHGYLNFISNFII
nr:hypothetical protein [Cytophagales bacterium]